MSRQANAPRKSLTSALALVAAGVLSLSLVAESSAQRGFGGGGFGGRTDELARKHGRRANARR